PVVVAPGADLAQAVIGPDDPATRVRIVVRIIRRVETAMEMPPVHERPVIGKAGAAVAQPAVAIAAASIDVRGTEATAAMGKAAAAESATVESSATTEATTTVETSAAAATAAMATHLDQIFTSIFRCRHRTRRGQRQRLGALLC